MGGSQSSPTGKDNWGRDLELHWFRGKNSIIDGGLGAEIFMSPKKYQKTRVERRRKWNARIAAAGQAKAPLVDTGSNQEAEQEQFALNDEAVGEEASGDDDLRGKKPI